MSPTGYIRESKIKIGEIPPYYNNRELSWLNFNQRVLEEAIDERNALLERYKFLAITSSNLDEFFMVRVAGLLDQVKAGFNPAKNKAGLTPAEQLDSISKITHELIEKQDDTYLRLLTPILEKEKVKIIPISAVSDSDLAFLEEQFNEHIFPALTPMAIDAYRPFPMLANKSLNLAIIIAENAEEAVISGVLGKLAIVQVPSVINRYIELPKRNGSRTFVLLEQVITCFIDKLFKGYQVESVTAFRITRNADLTIHEDEADDLLQEIEEELKKRKWGATVRLEIQTPVVDDQVVHYLIDELEVNPKDVYFVQAPLDMTFLFSFYNTIRTTHEHLVKKTYIPQVPQDLIEHRKIFLKQHSIKIFYFIIHMNHLNLLSILFRKRQMIPNVLAIKQTLYWLVANHLLLKVLNGAAGKWKTSHSPCRVKG